VIILNIIVNWLNEHGRIENSDDYAFYDRIITAWECLGMNMIRDLADLDMRREIK